MKPILLMRVKNRMKTDECIKNAQRIETHLGNEYSVLILDKNVVGIELFDELLEEPKPQTEQIQIKGEEENE